LLIALGEENIENPKDLTEAHCAGWYSYINGDYRNLPIWVRFGNNSGVNDTLLYLVPYKIVGK
jgi:hypothetical protein